MVRRACTVGVDVGGTKIAGIVLDGGDGVLESREIPTDLGRGGEDVLRRAVELTEDVMGGAGQAATCRRDRRRDPGDRLAGRRDRQRRRHTLAGPQVAERSRVLAPCILESDVRAAARAEAELGSGRGLHSFAYVNVGTGISSTLVLAGRPYGGSARGRARARQRVGELSAARTATQTSRSCSRRSRPGRRSSPAIASSAATQATPGTSSAPQAEGVPAARQTLDQAATALGSRIALLVDVLDPEAVIVGGGLGTTPGAVLGRSRHRGARPHLVA